MKKFILLRIKEGIEGTFGKLISTDLKFSIFTGELPDYNNQKNISRIPSGEYYCKYHYSNKFKWCYHVTNVQNRSWILTHNGNWCGDRTKGLLSHTYGCILVGLHYGFLSPQHAVLNSRVALKKLISFNKRKDFILQIL